MAKFIEIATGRVWDITNAEHLKHFRINPRFKEVKEEKKEQKKVEEAPKKEISTKKEK